ncbi:hypothetical protein Y032_0147g2581 [Ancylostoma ceylanicum]|uniref:SCP domain-containing protein n=1 Tax=Ancylostoma ceylanicum TaxID=53326 RepID=A0A016T1X0_9BILA|nr:hypothetical protein Y032_0147g2581 [Ancylostoma ceylanicum]
MIRSTIVLSSIFLLVRVNSNDNATEEVREPSTATPPPVDDHAVIICAAMSSPVLLRKLASTQGSIASLKLNSGELPSDPVTACSKPMCSLKEKSVKSDKDLAEACHLLKGEARKQNNIPLLFAEANKWMEIYGNPQNTITYTTGSKEKKQKLLSEIAKSFETDWDHLTTTQEPVTTTAAPSDAPIVIEFPKFTNRATIIFPSRWS